MIEVYAFLTMFAVQILAMSVLFPARLIKYSREQNTGVSVERLTQLYPGIDHELASNRFLTRICAGSAAAAVIGLLVLGWLFNYMRRPDWNLGTVIALNAVYFLVQFLPLVLTFWFTYRLYKTHELPVSDGKRTATLEPRRLFDFVSRRLVFLTALAYILFVAFVLNAGWQPSRALFLIGVLTLVYAMQAFDVYRALYGKKRGPIDTHAVRTHRTGFAVKLGVYVCLLNAVFFSFMVAIDLLDQKKWVPFAVSVLFVCLSLLMSTGITALIRRSAVDRLGPSPAS
jgi:MFS family permease